MDASTGDMIDMYNRLLEISDEMHDKFVAIIPYTFDSSASSKFVNRHDINHNVTYATKLDQEWIHFSGSYREYDGDTTVYDYKLPIILLFSPDWQTLAEEFFETNKEQVRVATVKREAESRKSEKSRKQRMIILLQKQLAADELQ